MKSLDQSTIRKQNVRKILDLLTVQSPRTRQSLAEATGLSLMTVTNLVDQLKAQQVLELTPVPRCCAGKPASGRKAENISLKGSGHAWMIIDLSGRNFRYTLLGFDFSLLYEKNCAEEGSYLPRLEAFLCGIRDELNSVLCGRALLGVAVVAPGPYEIASDTVYNQRLPELNAVRIKSLLQRCLGDYNYYVDEDVKFAVRAFAPFIVAIYKACFGETAVGSFSAAFARIAASFKSLQRFSALLLAGPSVPMATFTPALSIC